ncbi:MAG: Rne/Rng family ribonuclease [Candidatus Marinimicrobia bacterium]|jgi:ribonuclease G|nr:Rne/Rng family ribonuclease [Candidatus Neomarinimicrobiota bacterium]MDP6593984.1 Rne/Rng family ribonuclease [Candidatus Neomarinimicrobiota bacterium]MDP6835835.1 Rne/Rng family ribonuclease [Candidatus Neomarinimicrobiota bacterium]MDP6967138.1 Rne/Rng family ribonuclease [Candidatus Neomarinimicrobiota bacterium]|tara:strand:- start:855 stop:2381 length:1527 start_codon:yes stop_codon:yes gene_type:complete
MDKEIYVSETASERRIAVTEDNTLVELYIEKPNEQGMVGNIYKGQVENVIPGMQAAFVDIGFDINAFLPFSEISNPEYLKDASTSEEEDEGKNRKQIPPKEINVDLKSGQDILVQVIKEPFSGKGPRVTTSFAIPGHLVVIVPNASFIGISKKIWDKYEKRRLRKIVKGIVPKGMGIIVRTEAEGTSEKLIKKEVDQLIKNWNAMENKANHMQSPSLVHEDVETVSTVIRDILTSDLIKMLFDSRKLYRRFQSYLQNVSPGLVSKLELYRGRVPLFSKAGLDDQIEKSTRSRVWLKSGAYLIIEHTEAMVVADVNSGRFIGKSNHETNSLKINLEAARGIAQQLRLRDIGGLIVIDFIDMQEEKNKKKVYNELRKELRKDRAKFAVSPISDFGLLEMTRQRIRLSLLDTLSDKCPTCRGSGRIASKDAVITRIDNWLRSFRQKNRELRLQLYIHPSLAEYLKELRKDVIRKFMWQNFVHIDIEADESLPPDRFRFFSKKKGVEITDQV